MIYTTKREIEAAANAIYIEMKDFPIQQRVIGRHLADIREQLVDYGLEEGGYDDKEAFHESFIEVAAQYWFNSDEFQEEE